MTKTFDHLLLLGRPAAGKSEFIDFMKKTSDPERAEGYRIGRFEELDDFVWLWEKFCEDDLWEEAGYDRIYSKIYDGNNYGIRPDKGHLFDLMLTKFNHEAASRYISRPEYYEDGTLIVEFARGGKEGYARALPKLSKPLLERAAILYVQVTFDESWRRNLARYEEKQRHSILAHMVPRETLETFYKHDDWKRNKLDGISLLLGSCLAADTKVNIHLQSRRADAEIIKALIPSGATLSVWDGGDDMALFDVVIDKEASRDVLPILARNGAEKISVASLGMLYE